MLLRLWRFLDPRSGAPLWLRVGVLVVVIELTHAGLSWLLMPPGMYHYGWGALVVGMGAMPTILATGHLLDELEGLRQRMAVISATDALTGLANRRAFLDSLEVNSVARRDGILLLIDADHFKQVNDRYGHAAGDACLRALGDRLRAETRADDLVARLGGEEFAVFLSGLDLERARAVGQRLSLPLRVPQVGPDGDIILTASLGLAPVHRDASLTEPFRLADAALYRAKAAGRARLMLWTDGLAA